MLLLEPVEDFKIRWEVEDECSSGIAIKSTDTVWGSRTFMVEGHQRGWEQRSSHYLALL